jgi:spectinomycin phosphotransferase
MIEKQFFSEQRIIDCLKSDFDITVDTLTFLPLGADIDASVYKAQANDKSSYFVKLKRNNYSDINVTVQALLHDAGIKEIISPITTQNGLPTLYVDDFVLIVYPFIEGTDGFSHHLTNDQWVALGRALRQVHEFNIPLSIKNQIKCESYSPVWRDVVRSMYVHIETSSVVDDTISLKLLAFMQNHRLIIQRLVDRAEQLGHKIQQQSPQFVLCHADIHAGNIFIENNGTVYIVDWDQPIMAPKERDLMFIGGGVGGVWNDPCEEKFFYKGYVKTDINMTILAYYRHERIVEDIAFYSQKLLLTVDGGKDRQEMYKHFINMFEPLNVIDIAFKTDKDL